MLTYQERTLKTKSIAAEERKKQERMRDVTLLLQQLIEREETSLKLIIDCLIDVGSINYANHKLQNPSLNKLMKVLVGYVKPVARMLALRWLKKNLPHLLTTWLEGKVSFKSEPITKEESVSEDFETISITEEQAISLNQELSSKIIDNDY